MMIAVEFSIVLIAFFGVDDVPSFPSLEKNDFQHLCTFYQVVCDKHAKGAFRN